MKSHKDNACTRLVDLPDIESFILVKTLLKLVWGEPFGQDTLPGCLKSVDEEQLYQLHLIGVRHYHVTWEHYMSTLPHDMSTPRHSLTDRTVSGSAISLTME